MVLHIQLAVRYPLSALPLPVPLPLPWTNHVPGRKNTRGVTGKGKGKGKGKSKRRTLNAYVYEPQKF